MNTTKLEAALLSHCTGNFLDMHLEFNDHKSCYGTIEDHEKSYPNITYKWVSEEERLAAYAANEMWGIATTGAGKGAYRSNTSNKLSTLVQSWGEIDQETIEQAEQLAEWLRSQFEGKYASANITYTVGQEVTRYIDNKWVTSIDNVATIVAEEGSNFSDEEDWVSVEERQKAIDQNGIWSVQIYPNTPIGSYSYHAASLQAILEFLMRLS